MAHKPFGILRLQKLVFNCILHHMENSEEILSILRADIRRNGRQEVFHYRKICEKRGFTCRFVEKMLVYVDINDNTVVGLSVVSQTFSDGYRTVYIGDLLNNDHLLDFAFYNADFSFRPVYGIDNKHLSFSDIIRTEETSSSQLPDDEPETEYTSPSAPSEETAYAESAELPDDEPDIEYTPPDEFDFPF